MRREGGTVTAINVIKQKNAVHMITDGASWVFDGGFGPACCPGRAGGRWMRCFSR
jgi:hypothetical protein